MNPQEVEETKTELVGLGYSKVMIDTLFTNLPTDVKPSVPQIIRFLSKEIKGVDGIKEAVNVLIEEAEESDDKPVSRLRRIEDRIRSVERDLNQHVQEDADSEEGECGIKDAEKQKYHHNSSLIQLIEELQDGLKSLTKEVDAIKIKLFEVTSLKDVLRWVDDVKAIKKELGMI